LKLSSLWIFMEAEMNANAKGEKFWGEQVRAWRQSGLSQARYSARQGVSVASLRYWSARLAKMSGGLSLVPVQRIPAAPILGVCVLRAPSGWQLEFLHGTPAQYLAEVLGALR
jgi:hypothetical protein